MFGGLGVGRFPWRFRYTWFGLELNVYRLIITPLALTFWLSVLRSQLRKCVAGKEVWPFDFQFWGLNFESVCLVRKCGCGCNPESLNSAKGGYFPWEHFRPAEIAAKPGFYCCIIPLHISTFILTLLLLSYSWSQWYFHTCFHTFTTIYSTIAYFNFYIILYSQWHVSLNVLACQHRPIFKGKHILSISTQVLSTTEHIIPFQMWPAFSCVLHHLYNPFSAVDLTV